MTSERHLASRRLPHPMRMLGTVALIATAIAWPSHGVGAADPRPTAQDRSAADAVADAIRSARRFEFDLLLRTGGIETFASGMLDRPADRLRLDVEVEDEIGQAHAVTGGSTEFRRLGDRLYMNARRLGSPHNPWVELDTGRQGSRLSVRAASSFVDSLTPGPILDALENPGRVRVVERTEEGVHYRARIDDSSVIGLLPFVDALSPDTGLGAVDGRSAPVDVWVDTKGRLTGVTMSTTPIFLVVGFHAVANRDEVSAPPARLTGGLSSASADFLFKGGSAKVGRRLDLGGTASSVASQRNVAAQSLTVAPEVTFFDGVVHGTLNASSATGQQLDVEVDSGGDGGKVEFGTVYNGPTSTDPQSFTILPYATWLDDGGVKGEQTVYLRVTEVTKTTRFLTRIPLIGTIADAAITVLQGLPEVSDVLAPTIGEMQLIAVSIDLSVLAPGDTPIAFTYDVTSFDGTTISTNFFPASELEAGQTAPTILNGPGLGQPGMTNPYAQRGTENFVPGAAILRGSGYNVITWDPRGVSASGGILQLDNPFYEGRDVSALVTWASQDAPVTLDGPQDPRVGMVGGGYGGAIQLTAASTDPRIDAIVPGTAWNSLLSALAPGDVVNAAGGSQLLTALADARVNDQIARGLYTGVVTGQFSDSVEALLASSGPNALLHQLQAPTLLLQSTTDLLFPLHESVANAETIMDNPFGTPVKMRWFEDSTTRNLSAESQLIIDTLAWLNTYVAGNGDAADSLPAFRWWDQESIPHATDLMPFEPGFAHPSPITAVSDGGTLALSGSGAGGSAGAVTTIDVPIDVPIDEQIVGTPTLTFTYRGRGTSRAVFAQLVDRGAGQVVSPIATPVPVTLDGTRHTVSVPLADIVHVTRNGGDLVLRIKRSAAAFTHTSNGRVTISNITISLPHLAA